MKKFILSSLLLLSTLLATTKAQTAQGCDGKRYLQDIFITSDSSTTAFGLTTLNGKPDTLLADIYQPKGDTVKKRPLLILAFGGGFVFGTRKDDYMVALCKNFSKKGFVCASIDYRIYDVVNNGIPQDSLAITPIIIQSQQDMRAAVRFFKKDAATTNKYGIDTNNIIVGGVSAGAITAMNVAYLSDTTTNVPAWLSKVIKTQGGVEGTSGNPGYSSRVKGVMSMSGGLYVKEWINKNSPPFVAYHGTADVVVPYGYGTNVYNFYTQGDKTCYDYARSLGVPSVLLSVPGGGHNDIYDPAGPFVSSLTKWGIVAPTFLKQLVCGESINVATPTEEALAGFKISVSPNPSQDFINVDVQNITGKSLSGLTADILDISGRVLKNYAVLDNAVLLINKNDFGNGLFFVRIKDNAGGSVVRKIVFTD